MELLKFLGGAIIAFAPIIVVIIVVIAANILFWPLVVAGILYVLRCFGLV